MCSNHDLIRRSWHSRAAEKGEIGVWVHREMKNGSTYDVGRKTSASLGD